MQFQIFNLNQNDSLQSDPIPCACLCGCECPPETVYTLRDEHHEGKGLFIMFCINFCGPFGYPIDP